jgi:hypothetical protein
VKRGGPLKRTTWLRSGGRIKGRPGPATTAKAAARRLAQHGTARRTTWFNLEPCACRGRHPACTRGYSDPSHTTSRGAGGLAHQIIPQSRGCHTFIHTSGWLAWESPLGVDRHELAAYYATQGPDAPK